MNHFHEETIKVSNTNVRVRYYNDTYTEAPWDDCEGHGPVRISKYRHSESYSDKRPGERPLNRACRNEYQFYYDWQAAMKTAKADGCNTKPYDAPQQALRAVQSDFDFLKGYINDDWHYVGVEVVVLDENDEPIGEPDTCWGIETHKDCHLTYAAETAQSVADTYRKDLADAALAEHIANRYRDAMNLGFVAA